VALIVRGKRWAHLSACSTQAGRTQKPNTYTPTAARRRLITRLRKAVLAGRISLQQADAALAVRS
jgi:membrane peptidoglycan carboxypeptidase